MKSTKYFLMKKKELFTIAKERNIDVLTRDKKTEIIWKLIQHDTNRGSSLKLKPSSMDIENVKKHDADSFLETEMDVEDDSTEDGDKNALVNEIAYYLANILMKKK